MPDGSSLSWQEITGILERLGMEEIYRAGRYRVYVGDQNSRLVALVAERWDVPFGELMRNLSPLRFNRSEVEAALESLYGDH